jgi:N-carbamoyl-L-amino-acid hydrolase
VSSEGAESRWARPTAGTAYAGVEQGDSAPSSFRKLWDSLAPIGRDPVSGGYLRYAWSEPELACRRWFAEQAATRGMPVDEDGNGNLFAWWGDPDAGQPGGDGEGTAVLTGSHFDSVPHGGGYDGPLGIVSGLLAVDALRAAGVRPRRPIGVAAFAEEEGARFGVPCLGSRLLVGALAPERAAALTDRDGVTLADVLGGPPAGARPDLLGRVGCFVELHIEQGRALADLDAPVALASGIWPHGRWRMDFSGVGNHAGTTRMADRRDPMLTAAFTVLAANKEARLRGGHATVGRMAVEPNATNAVPASVTAWLDARAADDGALRGLVDAVLAKAGDRAGRDGTSLTVTAESHSPAVAFDADLAVRARAALGITPVLPTGAGHDAGALAAHVPTAMLFVRNPTGVSHAPAEEATDDDCTAGVEALTAILKELTCE